MTKSKHNGMPPKEHARLNGLKYKWYARLLTKSGFTTTERTVTQWATVSRPRIDTAVKLEKLTRDDPNNEGYVYIFYRRSVYV